MTEPLTTKTHLIGKILLDWCVQMEQEHAHIHFDSRLCDGLQNIRFTSDNLDTVFTQNRYDDGYILCYKLCNTSEHILLNVEIDRKHIGKRMTKLLS